MSINTIKTCQGIKNKSNNSLREIANILWQTESYPWQINGGNPDGEKNKQKNNEGKKIFEEQFLSLFGNTKLSLNDGNILKFETIKFNTNYNNYDLGFVGEGKLASTWYWFSCDNGNIYVKYGENIIQKLSASDKKTIKDMFVYNSVHQHQGYPLSFEE